MGYHIIEPIHGSPDAPYIPLWRRMGLNYDLPVVPRDEAIPPNRLQLIVVKTVNDAGELTHEIMEEVEWDLYQPYGVAAKLKSDESPTEAAKDQHRRAAINPSVDQFEAIIELAEENSGERQFPLPFSEELQSGELPIPPEFYRDHHLSRADYLECFILKVLPSGAEEWIALDSSIRLGSRHGDPEFDFDAIRATVTDYEITLE